MDQGFPFRFSPADVALIVELYLPKRAQYQTLLLRVLSRWYEWERRHAGASMKEHFKTNKARILELLEHYSSLRARYDAVVDGFPPGLAVGHSVYEVDGFFANAATSAVVEWATAAFAGDDRAAPIMDATAAEPETLGFAAEERTLVVRFIFPFPERPLVHQATKSYGDQREQRGNLEALFREVIRGFLRTPSGHSPEDYAQRLLADASCTAALERLAGDEAARAERDIKALLNVTDAWIHCVALWLFGYLVLEVTSGMNALVKRGELAKNEDEIWITSFWDVSLNRILPVKPESGAPSGF